MNRKEFLLRIWKWFCLPLSLMAVGYFVAVIFANIIADFNLIDFIVDLALIVLIITLFIALLSFIFKTVTQKITSIIPQIILQFIKRYYIKTSTIINNFFDWVAPIALGAVMYYGWVNGKKEFVIGYGGVLVFKKIRDIIRNEQNKPNAPTHIPPQA